MPAEHQSMVQASYRLTHDTYQAIREIAELKGQSQSQVMRSAAALLKHTLGLPDNIRLATVDINDGNKVKEWILLD